MDNLINKVVEDFRVRVFYQGKFREVTRRDTVGHWSVSLFYPADFTFVCPTEPGDLSDLYEDFKRAGCEIYSVSEDTHFVYKAWADASDTIKKIGYLMPRDPTGVLARNFGVLTEEEGQVLGRTSIVNPEGRMEAHEIHDMGIGGDTQELLRKVQAAQLMEEHGDQVCPAKWKPGEEMLTPNLSLVGML